jgi:hypothetical protein
MHIDIKKNAIRKTLPFHRKLNVETSNNPQWLSRDASLFCLNRYEDCNEVFKVPSELIYISSIPEYEFFPPTGYTQHE